MSHGIGDLLLCIKDHPSRYRGAGYYKEGEVYKLVDIVWDSYECGEPFYVIEIAKDKYFHIRCADIGKNFSGYSNDSDSVKRFDEAMGVISNGVTRI